MFQSKRFKYAHMAACRAYVLSSHFGEEVFTSDMEAMALRLFDRGSFLPLVSAAVAALVDGDTMGDAAVRAGCRAHATSDEVGDALMIHNVGDGGSATRHAAEGACTAWIEWPMVAEPTPRTAVIDAAKRLGVVHVGPDQSHWDWFTAWSPRNSNNHGEGPWEHWVALAVQVLRHPLTKIVHPDAHEAAHAHIQDMRRYSETIRELTPEELREVLQGADEVTFYRD
jgi:hypothetical protein